MAGAGHRRRPEGGRAVRRGRAGRDQVVLRAGLSCSTLRARTRPATNPVPTGVLPRHRRAWPAPPGIIVRARRTARAPPSRYCGCAAPCPAAPSTRPSGAPPRLVVDLRRATDSLLWSATLAPMLTSGPGRRPGRATSARHAPGAPSSEPVHRPRRRHRPR
ncbi:hypothetical protein HBB16_05355 [Pseudonocardia sp. MCCB 268]|nr:hypothetical protein [Pseudonocardia cytotoxica]